jgi:glycosyltransferase involved in cell wall biosynthesis
LNALLWRRYDLVLVSGFRLLGIPALLARLVTRKPTVLKADSSGELSGEYFRAGLARSGLALDSWPARQFVRLRNALLRRANAFVALSEEMAQELIEHGVPVARVYRIANGVDTELFQPATDSERTALRQRLGQPMGPVVIYTGRLVSYKGIVGLVRAWRNVRRLVPAATLVLAGEGGNDIHACEQELRDLVDTDRDLSASVRFTGAVNNVHDWLRAADLFVFPTENEAFGLSLVEAMACGLPAVTTWVGGLRDFVVPNVNALVVPCRDESALGEALQTLLNNSERAHELGRAARQTVLNLFSADVVADAYVAMFRQVLSATAAP